MVSIRFLITISDLQLKEIIVQKDHNIHTYSLFSLGIVSEENSRKHLLLVAFRNQVFLCFHFELKSQKEKKKKEKFHILFFNMAWSIEMKYNATIMYDTYTNVSFLI